MDVAGGGMTGGASGPLDTTHSGRHVHQHIKHHHASLSKYVLLQGVPKTSTTIITTFTIIATIT